MFEQNLKLGTYKVYIINNIYLINNLNVNLLRNLLRKCKYDQYMYICIICKFRVIHHVYHDYHLFKYSSIAAGNGDMVKFDLETLEPVENTDASDIVNEIPFPATPASSGNLNLGNPSDSDSSENNDYYKVSTDSEEDDLPIYSINNLEITEVEGNETNHLLIEVEDTIGDWTNEIINSGPSYGPFLSSRYTNIQNPYRKPEVFFQSIFDE